MKKASGTFFAIFTITSFLILCLCFVDAVGADKTKTHVAKYYCEKRQHKIIEIGYFTHGFHQGRKQYFIKHYHINNGWTEDYCADGYTRCRVKMGPTLVRSKHITKSEMESYSAYLADECVHTFTIKDGELKHAPSKKWGYTY